MAEKQFKVIDKTGIHARPATELVNEANKYKSDITIIHNGKESNLKSILGVMSLGVGPGEEFSIRTEGEDADEALAGLEKTLKEQGLAE